MAHAKSRRHFFSKLNEATYFTTLDLWADYHDIPLDKPSIPKTTFNSPFGKYEYMKVPFDLAQMPAYFQELMTGILKELNFTIVYLDDIIIFSKTSQKHLSHIRMVFKNSNQPTFPWKRANATSFLKKSSI